MAEKAIIPFFFFICKYNKNLIRILPSEELMRRPLQKASPEGLYGLPCGYAYQLPSV
jgi:hypothetical protein